MEDFLRKVGALILAAVVYFLLVYIRHRAYVDHRTKYGGGNKFSSPIVFYLVPLAIFYVILSYMLWPVLGYWKATVVIVFILMIFFLRRK